MLDLTQKKDVHIDERLRSNIIVWFTTVRADGRPHSVAVWFLWDGSQILIFSQPNKQKLRNLQHNPHVVLALDNTKNGGDAIVIEGKAELIDNTEVNSTLPAYAEKYTPMLNEMGLSPESMAADYSQAIRVTPTKFMAVS